MGFCLLENNDGSGAFVAVNAGQIEQFSPCKDGHPYTDIVFYGGKAMRVKGLYEDVKVLLRDASKIGLNAAALHVLGSANNMWPMPLQFRGAQAVLYVREVAPEKLPPERPAEVMTASKMYLETGDNKLIVERPGIFASRVNEKGKVPILDLRGV